MEEVSFELVPCDKPGCSKVHGVVAVKRRHARYTGPEVSPLRAPGDGSALPSLEPSPGVLTDAIPGPSS